MEELCKSAPDDPGEPETATACLRSTLKFLTVLVGLGQSLSHYHFKGDNYYAVRFILFIIYYVLHKELCCNASAGTTNYCRPSKGEELRISSDK